MSPVNIDDAKGIIELVWHQDTSDVTLSDGKIVAFVGYEGNKEPNITADAFYLLEPAPLEELVFALLENGKSFIVEANGKRKICGFTTIKSSEGQHCGSHH